MAKINSNLNYGGFIAKTNKNVFVEMISKNKVILKFGEIQGRSSTSNSVQYVKKIFDIYIKLNEEDDYEHIGTFDGCDDSDTIVRFNFKERIGRYIKLVPLEYESHISLRWEIYGSYIHVPLVKKYFNNLKSLTEYNDNHSCKNSLIDYYPKSGESGSWCSLNNNTPKEYIEISFNRVYTVTHGFIQGRYDYDQWVKKFSIWYEDENGELEYLNKFDGNSDRNTHVKFEFTPVKTKLIRLVPEEFHGHVSLRWELYGYELN